MINNNSMFSLHQLTSEELEKRRVRRERNKQAALRCRTRRRERIDTLEQVMINLISSFRAFNSFY